MPTALSAGTNRKAAGIQHPAGHPRLREFPKHPAPVASNAVLYYYVKMKDMSETDSPSFIRLAQRALHGLASRLRLLG